MIFHRFSLKIKDFHENSMKMHASTTYFHEKTWFSIDFHWKIELALVFFMEIYIALTFRIDFHRIFLFCDRMPSISSISLCKTTRFTEFALISRFFHCFFTFSIPVHLIFTCTQSFQHIKTNDSMSWLRQLQVFSFEMKSC